MFSELRKFRFVSNKSKQIRLNMFICTENKSGSHKKMEITICNTTKNKHTQNHFQQSIFQQYISLGFTRPLKTAFELTN